MVDLFLKGWQAKEYASERLRSKKLSLRHASMHHSLSMKPNGIPIYIYHEIDIKYQIRSLQRVVLIVVSYLLACTTD